VLKNKSSDIIGIPFQMTDIILWAEQATGLSQKLSQSQNLTSLNASSFLLVCYFLASLTTRKCRYIVAFILCEIFGSLSIFNSLTDTTFYLCYASFYCLLYYHCVYNVTSIETRLSCITMVLFESMVGMDAYLYEASQTFIHSNYVNIVVFIHLYIISTTICWRRIRTRMGESLSSIARIFCANDVVKYVCYNVRTKKR